MIEPGFLKPNSGYGDGMAFRRIRLTRTPGQVLAELEDLCHGMRSIVRHDGARIIAVDNEMIRVPMNNCLSAGEALHPLVGLPIDSDMADAYRAGDPRANCTHLFDMTWLAIAHIHRAAPVRQYDIAVQDEQDGLIHAMLRQDGAPVLEWTLRANVIQPPHALAGQHLFRGFTRHVREALEGDAVEHALVLQKGCFVADARRWIIDENSPPPINDPNRLGACYTYAPERIAQARRIAGRHPAFFADTPDELLRFLPQAPLPTAG